MYTLAARVAVGTPGERKTTASEGVTGTSIARENESAADHEASAVTSPSPKRDAVHARGGPGAQATISDGGGGGFRKPVGAVDPAPHAVRSVQSAEMVSRPATDMMRPFPCVLSALSHARIANALCRQTASRQHSAGYMSDTIRHACFVERSTSAQTSHANDHEDDMKPLLRCISTCALLACAPLVGAARQHVLDLTRSDLVVTIPPFATGSSSTVSGQQRVELPLVLELANLDWRVYVVGRELKWEIIIKNIGNAAFAFPWSTDRELIERPGESFSQVTLGLQATDAAGREYLLASAILDGSTRVPGSIETLLPGEEAVIRSEERINFPSETAAQIAAGGPLEIKAVLTMKAFPMTTWWKPVLSSNKVDVSIRASSRRN